MNYIFLCILVDHYADLVKTARSGQEREIRLEGWFYYFQKLIEYEN